MIKEQFDLACTFFKERVRKPWLIILVAFVVIWFGLGFCVSQLSKEDITDFVLSQDTSVQMVVVGSSGEEAYTWFQFLFHNGFVDLISIVVGFIPFVPVSVLIALFNAVTWGFMAGLGGTANGAFFSTLTLGMLPHCIFETPANAIAAALGFVLCATITKRILKKTDEKILPLVANCLRVFVFFVLPLLLIAGIVEANVTPLIVANFLL